MPPEESVLNSLLDKPLQQLTEDDISQLTREDCRRYLKLKGMRRPSWNKSQAIQQVISLKALLETASDSDAGFRKKLYIPRSDTSVHRVQRGKNTDEEFIELAEETVPDGRKQQEETDLSGDATPTLVAAIEKSAPSRILDSVDTPVEQMTIFYSGKVNVYDDVPADKAQIIMRLASSPLCVPSETSSNATAAARHSTCCLGAANTKLRPDPDMALLPTIQTEAVESPSSRKASVQRYLEKRKDRFKCKRKVEITSSASLDIYLNGRMGSLTPSEHSSRTDLCFAPHIRLSTAPTPSGPLEENIQMNAPFSSGPNDRC
ncbi:protein TIFY 4B isoform X1 [Nicotiana tabacum]|uniref:Protein TIFY n=2 Tax=Nicotiana tabacum TaxID=4097 RepID=A0A1S4DKD9_TOBAC|nr:protein TIFY 4B-like isoform X2 [Nicotiana tomentosiformis]XP_016513860.1 PREDICTED: protein TIFY 4B-like isoform X1 [Nicotiana tabacum]